MSTAHMIPRLLRSATLASLLALGAGMAQAQTLCVYDPISTQGTIYAAAKDFALAAKKWGANLTPKAYTNEGVVAEDFKAGRCDMAVMSGLRARQFNMFTGTLDAVGGLENYDQLGKALNLMASPKLESRMKSGPYEVAGVFALGAGYVFVNDRKIDQLAKAAGKKVAVLEWDKSQTELVRLVGAEPVQSSIADMAPKFNNGVVDILVAPALLYSPFELWKGMAKKGAVADFPIIQLTGQAVIRTDKFPAGFGAKSRAYAYSQLAHNLDVIKKQEAKIDPKFWMRIAPKDKAGYANVMREARLKLADDGFYDREMLALLKHVRCAASPKDAECSMKDE